MIALYFGEHFITDYRNKDENKRRPTHRTAVAGLAVILSVLLCAGCGNTEQATSAPEQTQTMEQSM